MINDTSGAKVWWDHQIGTFSGRLDSLRVGNFGGDIATVVELESRLGVSLSAETVVALNERQKEYPMDNRIFVSKLQFMDLFRPDDLIKIYDAARVSSAVQIELDRVTRAPNDQIELTDPRTAAGLVKMEAAGLIQPGDAERIKKGIAWA